MKVGSKRIASSQSLSASGRAMSFVYAAALLEKFLGSLGLRLTASV